MISDWFIIANVVVTNYCVNSNAKPIANGPDSIGKWLTLLQMVNCKGNEYNCKPASIRYILVSHTVSLIGTLTDNKQL